MLPLAFGLQHEGPPFATRWVHFRPITCNRKRSSLRTRTGSAWPVLITGRQQPQLQSSIAGLVIPALDLNHELGTASTAITTVLVDSNARILQLDLVLGRSCRRTLHRRQRTPSPNRYLQQFVNLAERWQGQFLYSTFEGTKKTSEIYSQAEAGWKTCRI